MALRRQRWTLGEQAAHETGASARTGGAASCVAPGRADQELGQLAEPATRDERKKPGHLIHLDIEELGRFERVGHRITGDRTAQSNSRGIGWEFVHVCIDDNSRISFSQIFPDEKAVSAMAFLKAALAYYKGLGVSVARVMTEQRLLLQIPRLPRSVSRPQAQAHPHQAIHAQDQWKGRALHPNRPARVGLRKALPEFRPARRRVADMATSIQLASTPRRHQTANTHQPPRPDRGQPVEHPQLEPARNSIRYHRTVRYPY